MSRIEPQGKSAGEKIQSVKLALVQIKTELERISGELDRILTGYHRFALPTKDEIRLLRESLPEKAEIADQLRVHLDFLPAPAKTILESALREALGWRKAIEEALKNFSDEDLDKSGVTTQAKQVVQSLKDQVTHYEPKLLLAEHELDEMLQASWGNWRPNS